MRLYAGLKSAFRVEVNYDPSEHSIAQAHQNAKEIHLYNASGAAVHHLLSADAPLAQPDIEKKVNKGPVK